MIILFFFLLLPLSAPRLLMVLEIFRHGAREPVYDYWNARSFREFGELTSVGMHQHYVLGQYIRQHYINTLHFLSPRHEPEEFYVRSTDLNRTIVSAISQLYGLFPLEEGPFLPSGIEEGKTMPPIKDMLKRNSKKRMWNQTYGLPMGFQPVPVISFQEKDDPLLRPYMPSLCPVNIMMETRQKMKQKYQEWREDFKESFKALEVLVNNSGMTNITITMETASRLYDVFEADRYYNKRLPQNLTTELWNNLTFVSNMNLYYVKLGGSDQQKFQATPFFKEIIDSFDNKLSAAPNTIKFKMFSAHDMTLSYLLTGLNLTSYECLEEVFRTGETKEKHCFSYPEFASNMFIELEEDDLTGEKMVRVKYNGENVNLCERESFVCEYAEFKQRLEGFMIEDFKSVCKNRAKSENNIFTILQE